MTREEFLKIAEVLKGLKKSEWQKVSSFMEYYYSLKAAEITFDDSELIEKLIKTGPTILRQSE